MPSFIKVSNLSYSFQNGKKLFDSLSFNVSTEKIGLTGDNGYGKTTLLRLISGELIPSSGSISVQGTIVKFNQDHAQLSELSAVEILGVKNQLLALERIADGTGNEDDFSLAENNWDIEQRIDASLAMFGLAHVERERKFSSLSGGEAGRLLLASCLIKNPDFILFDEPTNHLDSEAREAFYNIVSDYKKGLLVVSHDRALLWRMDKIIELSDKGIKIYGGAYDFYYEQKQIEKDAIIQKINAAETELKKQIKLAASVVSAKEKKNSLAKLNRGDGSTIKTVLNKRRNNAERTLAHLAAAHEKKIDIINDKLQSLKNGFSQERLIKLDLAANNKFKAKFLVSAMDVNYSYEVDNLWNKGVSFEIASNDRVLIAGRNGSGKTTLINLITQKITPTEGSIKINCANIGLIDQKYGLLNPGITIFENIKRFAPSNMSEHELRIRLGRFLFYKDDAFKITGTLSGGEKCRLSMACLLAASNMPDLIILDEPTNNLDLTSIEQMQSALNSYSGSLAVISHDVDFAQSIGINKIINLDEISGA
jgi:ATPase subunit of ABC transporter with duplicated ATPase domains